jgi:hypothetical protein
MAANLDTRSIIPCVNDLLSGRSSQACRSVCDWMIHPGARKLVRRAEAAGERGHERQET